VKVRIIKTGEVKTVADGYALRLIEQGMAAPVKEETRPAARKAPEARAVEPKAESKKKIVSSEQ
jgi:ribosomal protein L9